MVSGREQPRPLASHWASQDEVPSTSFIKYGPPDSVEALRGYYTMAYTQFCTTIMIATFTGGVQAAVLSFMNDLLSGEPFSQGSKPHTYSAHSLGLLLGLFAVALDLTVATVAAVNAALACHFSIHIPRPLPKMEPRIVLCMVIQFMAFCAAGISLALLCSPIDAAFTTATASLFLSAFALSGYYLLPPFRAREGWGKIWNRYPLHATSAVLSTTIVCLDMISLSQSMWLTVIAHLATISSHMIVILHKKSAYGDRPRRRYISINVVIACIWAGCAVLTLVLKGRWDQGRSTLQERVLRYVIAALAGVEALVLLGIGAIHWVYTLQGRGINNDVPESPP